jgi:hypothetical protein
VRQSVNVEKPREYLGIHAFEEGRLNSRSWSCHSIKERLVGMDAEYQKDLDWLAESKNWVYINCRFEDVKGVNQPRELTDRSTLSSLLMPNA